MPGVSEADLAGGGGSLAGRRDARGALDRRAGWQYGLREHEMVPAGHKAPSSPSLRRRA
jgi:hypothetical protein